MARAQRSGRIEWLTLGLFVGFYVAWLAVILLHRRLPWPVSLALLAVLGGFYMSLQHEALHGHPTSRRSVNTALAFAPLSLWLPYLRYRRSHIVHHGTDLTDPQDDPTTPAKEGTLKKNDQWLSASGYNTPYAEDKRARRTFARRSRRSASSTCAATCTTAPPGSRSSPSRGSSGYLSKPPEPASCTSSDRAWEGISPHYMRHVIPPSSGWCKPSPR